MLNDKKVKPSWFDGYTTPLRIVQISLDNNNDEGEKSNHFIADSDSNDVLEI